MPNPYQFLEKISTEELRRLLREDFESSDESTPENDEFITKVMEVVAQREESASSVPVFDSAAGWENFQKNYRPMQGNLVSLCDDAQLEALTCKHRDVKSPHQASIPDPKRRIKPFALVAATIGLFMTLLMVAQAAGLDVFGAMARWTDETFSFISTPASNEATAFRTALEKQGIPKEYAPTWVPAGFKAGSPQVSSSKRTTELSVTFSNSNKEFVFAITKYASSDAIETISYEKNLGDAILYSNGRQLFYIFDNVESCVAAWSDGQAFAIGISGEISIDDMKSIIDSIGG